MYWAVVGAFIAIESTIGPFISWLPFYWETRTLFLLYLSLPQIQGSTYIYKTYFEPFCSENEAELDSGIASAQNNVLGFLQSRISMLIDLLWTILNKAPITKHPQAAREGQTGQQPYSLESVKGLWASYGPAIMGGLSSTKTSSSPDTTAKQATFASGADVNHNGGHAPEARSEFT